MKYFKTYIFLFASALIFSSCGRSSLNPVEYVRYVQDANNGLAVQENINGVKYVLQYQPADYLVLLETGDPNITPQAFKQEHERFKGLEHYNLQIDRKGLDSLLGSEQKTQRSASNGPNSVLNTQYSNPTTEYLDFGIKNDIKLIEGNDTVRCAICECESDGGIHPYYSFIIGFPKKEFNGDRQFLLNGKRIKAGDVKFFVTRKSITEIPEVRI